MIHSVFEFGDTIAREGRGARRVGADIVAFAYLKDVVRRVFEDPGVEFTQRVDEVMRPALYVPESKPVDALLSEMQSSRQHIAVVVAEYGGTAGPLPSARAVQER